MITKQGQSQLLKMIGNKAFRFADLFTVGVSNATLTNTATQLDFGWATCPITDSYVDLELNQVVFHGTLPAALAGNVVEIGLISQSDEFIRSGLPNSLVYSFEPQEAWYSDDAYEVTNTGSIGTNNYKLVNATVGRFLAKPVGQVDVSRYDTMKMNLTATGVTKIKMYLKNDELRYAHKDLTITAGAQTVSQAISGFTKVGAFDPKAVTEIRFEIVTASGTNSIEFDALSLTSIANGGLVARSVLTTAQYKRNGSTMELEYAVAL